MYLTHYIQHSLFHNESDNPVLWFVEWLVENIPFSRASFPVESPLGLQHTHKGLAWPFSEGTTRSHQTRLLLVSGTPEREWLAALRKLPWWTVRTMTINEGPIWGGTQCPHNLLSIKRALSSRNSDKGCRELTSHHTRNNTGTGDI